MGAFKFVIAVNGLLWRGPDKCVRYSEVRYRGVRYIRISYTLSLWGLCRDLKHALVIAKVRYNRVRYSGVRLYIYIYIFAPNICVDTLAAYNLGPQNC